MYGVEDALLVVTEKGGLVDVVVGVVCPPSLYGGGLLEDPPSLYGGRLLDFPPPLLRDGLEVVPPRCMEVG